VHQQCRRSDPAIFGIEMAGMFATAMQFGEQSFYFLQHGVWSAHSPLNFASDRTGADFDGRFWRPLRSGQARTSLLSSSKTALFSTSALPHDLIRGEAWMEFLRKMKG
jgi:hypothetical protein